MFAALVTLPASWQIGLGLVCIALAVWAIARQIDVRLTLFVAALALGTLAGHPEKILIKFFETFTDEKFALPICSAMGFAYVLKNTGCDQHLVHLLVKPLTRVRVLLIPGTVVVGFLVNMPVVSQTSTAATIGPVVIPILEAAGFSRLSIGAAILLGSSVGGELFNPGAPELQTTLTGSQKAAKELQQHPERISGQDVNLDDSIYTAPYCVQRLVPLNLLALFVSTAIFWLGCSRQEPVRHESAIASGESADPFRINVFKALVPLFPIVFLYLTSPMFHIGEVPKEWLVGPKGGSADTRLVGLAMLLGCALAALVSGRKCLGVADSFFQGAGFGFTHIVSLIVTANCFGEGLSSIGLAQAIGEQLTDYPQLLIPVAGYLSLGFAALSGSGMATAQSLFGFFAEPSLLQNIDPAHTGAVVSLAAAAGRTMSPVAAVALMCSAMTGIPVLNIVRRIAWPLFLSTTAVILAGLLMAPQP